MQLFDWTPEGDKKRLARIQQESPREFALPNPNDLLVQTAIRAQELFAEVGQPLDVFEATAIAMEALQAVKVERSE